MMRNLKIGWKLIVIAAMAVVLPMRTVQAQATGTLRGTVVDSTSHQPVPGAQVQLVGTNRSTFTDASGVYTLTGVSVGPATVRVQRIGFAQRTVTANVDPGTTVAADISLQSAVTNLAQVVVIGYGSSNRADVSGALSTVSASQIQNTPIAGLDAMLQGKAAGVQVTQNAGNPAMESPFAFGFGVADGEQSAVNVVDGAPFSRETSRKSEWADRT